MGGVLERIATCDDWVRPVTFIGSPFAAGRSWRFYYRVAIICQFIDPETAVSIVTYGVFVPFFVPRRLAEIGILYLTWVYP